MANAITSLRLCTTIDWRDYVEAVSLVDNVLRRDPAGVYSRMDFLSRDRQRQAVEELAEPTGEAQIRVALKAVETARQVAAQSRTPRRRARRLSPDRPRPRRPRARPRLSARSRSRASAALVRAHATASISARSR